MTILIQSSVSLTVQLDYYIKPLIRTLTASRVFTHLHVPYVHAHSWLISIKQWAPTVIQKPENTLLLYFRRRLDPVFAPEEFFMTNFQLDWALGIMVIHHTKRDFQEHLSYRSCYTEYVVMTALATANTLILCHKWLLLLMLLWNERVLGAYFKPWVLS